MKHKKAIKNSSVGPTDSAPEADLKKIPVQKARTRKGALALKRRQPQVREAPKTCLFLRTNSASHRVVNFLRDLNAFQKPHSVFFAKSRRMDLHPFEDISQVEHLCAKNGCQTFCIGSSSKKHPFRVFAGRTFDSKLLDIYEFDVSDYQGIAEFKNQKHSEASKPLVICNGPEFETSDTMLRLRTFLFDFFGGSHSRKIFLKGIDHVVYITALEPDPAAPEAHKIAITHFRIILKKGEGKLPKVELSEIGPSFLVSVGRVNTMGPEVWEAAMQLPSELTEKKVKNVKKGSLGESKGKIHVGTQDLTKMHTPHFH